MKQHPKEVHSLYPFKFTPILKSVIWGGSDISSFKGITPVQAGIGESWEVSQVPGNVSVVSEGALTGANLDALIRLYGADLLGASVLQKTGSTFPLLIKFIDARDNLSIQVHPDDVLAKERHNSFGKTEMWYVVKATPQATLYSGFAKPLNPSNYADTIADNTFTDYLKQYKVQQGDVFFLPAGRVHAIGAGCFIAEIQQSSDITYRIYDYNRKDAQGKGRELHTQLAQDAIDFAVQDDYKTHYQPKVNEAVTLATCNYFTTQLLDLTAPIVRNHATVDSFVCYIALAGECTLYDSNNYSTHIKQGQTMLVPAACKDHIRIEPHGGVQLLETLVV